MESIYKAADLLADTIKRDGLIYIAGAGGHSQIPAMEMFYRAGGLANVSIMFGPGLGLFDARPCLERTTGMGKMLMAYHDVQPEDAVIVCNYYGINAATIDIALAAKQRAGAVIGLTSTGFADRTPPDFPARHPSGKNLTDIVDLVLDTHSDKDEQIVSIPGIKQKVGAGSTISAVMIIQLLTIRTIERCSERDIEAPVFMSANIQGGDETNEALLRKYMPRIRHLFPESENYSGR
jgi:uncharacterized phosphosugar-binding protein